MRPADWYIYVVDLPALLLRISSVLADAAFSGLTFLNILFGRPSLDEVRAAFPDCYARDVRAAALIGALFRKRPSLVRPVT